MQWSSCNNKSITHGYNTYECVGWVSIKNNSIMKWICKLQLRLLSIATLKIYWLQLHQKEMAHHTRIATGSGGVRCRGSRLYCGTACRLVGSPIEPRGAPAAALVWELIVLPTRSRAHHHPARGRPPARAPPLPLLGDRNSEAVGVGVKSKEKMDGECKKK
jgi:hypothetical protein